MRTSVACDSCRKRKIKCVNSGAPPCLNCERRGLVNDCTLKTTKHFRRERLIVGQAHTPATTALSKKPISYDDCFQKEFFNFEKVIQLTKQNHPELLFVSLPCISDPDNQLIKESVKKALYLLVKPYMSKQSSITEDSLLNIHPFEKELMDGMLDKNMAISLLQLSLVLILLNWQSGNTRKAWILHGLCSRTTIYFLQEFNKKEINQPLTGTERELFIRTIWSSHLMAQTLRDKCDVEIITTSQLKNFPLPIDDMDLIFGNHSSPNQEESLNEYTTINDGMNTGNKNLPALLILSYQIFSECMTHILKGGRRTFFEVPWIMGSQWNELNEKIDSFWNKLGPREKFSLNNLKGYYRLGQSSLYSQIHLNLLVSKILLHRDYIPFIPSGISKPCGPIDPPNIVQDAPDTWWEQSSSQIFDSAIKIANIVEESQRLNTHCFSPMFGFATFTSACMLSYTNNFPGFKSQINSPNSDNHNNNNDHFYRCVEYLSKYGEHWKLGLEYNNWSIECSIIYEIVAQTGGKRLSVVDFQSIRDKYISITSIGDPVEPSDQRNVALLFQPRDQWNNTSNSSDGINNNNNSQESISVSAQTVDNTGPMITRFLNLVDNEEHLELELLETADYWGTLTSSNLKF